MTNDLGALMNAVHTAASPVERIEAANALAKEIAAASSRGEDIRMIFTGAFGNAATVSIGSAQLVAIGQVQRYLAAVAAGEIVPTLPDVVNVFSQLTAVLGGSGIGIPKFPGAPSFPAWPGMPFQIPQMPAVDPAALIKCLAESMGCSCGQGGSGLPSLDGKGDDPVRKLVDSGLGLIRRARDLAHDMERQAKQDARDLAAAANYAKGAAKDELEAAKKNAEANARDLGARADQMGHTIANAIVSRW